MMPDASRRIRQLRISSQDESSISADINALQDAFNIASMPGLPPNGLLLVRKLDLGVFRSRSTSIAISKLIDEKIRGACYQPVCVDQLESPQQNVVWFSDYAEVVFALLELVLKGQIPTAWYWSVIFPSLRKSNDLADILNVVGQDLPQSEVKPLVLVRMMQRLISHRNIESIFEMITLPLAQTMAIAAGLYPRLVSVSETESNSQLIYLPEISGRWTVVIKEAIQYWGDEDPRSHWLAFCSLVIANPALVESRQIWPSINSLIKAIALKEYQTKHQAITQEELSATPFKKTVGQGKVGVEDLDHESFDQPLINTRKTAAQDAAEQVNLPATIDHNQNKIDVEFKFEGLLDCEYSGFGFLVSLLDLLSIDELLSENPRLVEINFPVRIMRLVAKRFGLDHQHPLLQALPESPDCSDQLVENFIIPEDWKTLFKFPKNIDSLLYRPSINKLETTVQLLMSRFLYRYTKMSLRSLIIREGQIAITRTHLDFLFNIDQLDIRIRRTGLDINPGWVSWLGMVVQFHYQQEDRSDA